MPGILVKDGHEDVRYPLDADLILLGRGANCAVRILSRSVSRVHARLVREGEQLSVEDLSKFGTFVNGQRIQGRHMLSDRDQLRIADHVFLYRADEREPETMPPDGVKAELPAPHRPAQAAAESTFGQPAPARADQLAKMVGELGRLANLIQPHLRELRPLLAAVGQQLESAGSLQETWLPRGMPKVKGYDVWHSHEAARSLHGDHYGVAPLGDGRLLIFAGDSFPEGVVGALLSAALLRDIRPALAANESDPARALARLNQELLKSCGENRFVTLLLAVLDPEEHLLTLASAGSPFPLIRRRLGGLDSLADELSGPPLGTADFAEFSRAEVSIEPYDKILIYTDGLIEAMSPSGDAYSLETVRARLTLDGDRPCEQFGQSLVADVKKHLSGQKSGDDLTLVLMERTD